TAAWRLPRLREQEAGPLPRRDFRTRGQPRVATPSVCAQQRHRDSGCGSLARVAARTAVAVCAVLVERARGRADGIAARTGCDEERVFSFAVVAHAAGSDVMRMRLINISSVFQQPKRSKKLPAQGNKKQPGIVQPQQQRDATHHQAQHSFKSKAACRGPSYAVQSSIQQRQQLEAAAAISGAQKKMAMTMVSGHARD
ncbi:hypothetical protein Dimus_000822, partial [Dionaea muscipula]